MKKYIWHHYFNNQEVSKTDFLKKLSQFFLKCDTNNANPLTNISYVDEQALNREYNYLKRNYGARMIWIDDNTNESWDFYINREEIKK